MKCIKVSEYVCVCACVCVCVQSLTSQGGVKVHIPLGGREGQHEVSLSLSLCVVVQSLSCVRLFATLQTATLQAPLSFTISWSLLRVMSIESVMPSNHLILCRPLLLPSIFPSSQVFFNESALRIGWPKYWRFSFSISPSSEYSGLVSFRIYWFDLIYGVCLMCFKKSFHSHVRIFISLF